MPNIEKLAINLQKLLFWGNLGPCGGSSNFVEVQMSFAIETNMGRIRHLIDTSENPSRSRGKGDGVATKLLTNPRKF